MIRLQIDDVPEKYVAYAIARSGVRREELQLEWKSGCVYKVEGQIRRMICEFNFLLFTFYFFTFS